MADIAMCVACLNEFLRTHNPQDRCDSCEQSRTAELEAMRKLLRRRKAK